MINSNPQLNVSVSRWMIYSLIGIIIGPVIFLGWIYPLLPNNATGWFACVGVGAVLGFWTVVNIQLLDWLQRRAHFRVLYKALGAIVAMSLGATIFWVALKSQAFVQANFSYFGR